MMAMNMMNRIQQPIGIGFLVAVSVMSLSLAITPGADGEEMGPVEPLENRLSRLFASVRSDPVPKELCAESHFVVSDESDHWLFKSDLSVPGGAYLCVGTDNNYTMAGWGKPDYLILMDFDQVVVDVHKVYRAVFLAAPSPEAFMSLWAKESASELREILIKTYEDPVEQMRVLKAYRISRNLIEWRLKTQMRFYRAKGIQTFMDDPQQYEFIANLYRTNRVLLSRGDLTGKRTMKDIARVLKELGVPVRVVNLSNTEAYFDYMPSYRENIAALPIDENTLILSTSLLTTDPWAAQGHYRYYIQKGLDYVSWLQRASTFSAKTIRMKRVKGHARGLYRLGPPPEPRQLKKHKSGS